MVIARGLDVVLMVNDIRKRLSPEELAAVLITGEQLLSEIDDGVAKIKKEEKQRLNLLKKERRKK